MNELLPKRDKNIMVYKRVHHDKVHLYPACDLSKAFLAEFNKGIAGRPRKTVCKTQRAIYESKGYGMVEVPDPRVEAKQAKLQDQMATINTSILG